MSAPAETALPDVPEVGSIVEVRDTPDTTGLAGELAVVRRFFRTAERGRWFVELGPWVGVWDVDSVTLLAAAVVIVAEPAQGGVR